MTCPLCSMGITPLRHYYEAVRPSPSHRYFWPRGCSACALYGLFVVKRTFRAAISFSCFLRRFLCSIWNPVSSPRPTVLQGPARAGAVKVGRRTDLSKCSALARPHLDSSEHGGTSQADGLGPKLSGCLQRPPFIALGAEPRHWHHALARQAPQGDQKLARPVQEPARESRYTPDTSQTVSRFGPCRQSRRCWPRTQAWSPRGGRRADELWRKLG